MTISVDGGGSTGANLPSPKSAAVGIARDVAGRAGLNELSDRATLMLRKPGEISYQDNRFGDGSESAVQNAGLLGKVTRTGSALVPNWSFRSGDQVGQLREVSDDEARWNEPPEDGKAGGMLFESGAGSNPVRNPRAEGAIIGDISGAGSLPTNWTLVQAGGLTITVVGVVSNDGWPCVRLRLNGTQTADTVFAFEGATQLVAVSGNAYVNSFNLRIEEGSVPSGATIESVIYEYTTGGAYVSGGTGGVITVDGENRRFWHTRTFSGGGTVGRGLPGVYLYRNGSDRTWSNVEIDIGLPQFENAILPSSPMVPPPGAPAASTRGAETRNGGLQCSRDGRAYAVDWDFTSGGLCGPVTEFQSFASRYLPGGLYKDPAMTNYIRNPRWVGASAPSTWPTNMAVGASGNMTWTCDGRGTDAHGDYLQITLSGTASADARFDLEGITQIAGVNGDHRVLSLGVRVVSGVMPGTLKMMLFERTAGAVTVTTHETTIAPDHRFRRYWVHALFDGGGTTAYAHPALYIDNPSGVVACVFRLYIPQVEYGIRPTGPMLPEPGATGEATRAGEVYSFDLDDTFDPAGGWTLAVEYEGALDTTTGFSASTPFIATVQPAAGSAGYGAFYQSLGFNVPLITSSSSGIAFGGTQGAIAPGTLVRAAVAYAPDDMAASASGVSQVTDAGGTVAETLTGLELGSIQSGSNWQGRFTEVRLFSSRLPDAELEYLVGNS